LSLALILSAVAVAQQPVQTVWAQGAVPAEDAELARRFAPVLYFHPAELFRPQTVDVMVNTARLRRVRRGWPDVNVLPRVSLAELFNYHDSHYALDVWYGDRGASDYANYTAHRAHYRETLSPQAGGPPIATYAHVVRDEDPEHTTIQYWLFYLYNDWFNKHEGDWEMVQVTLDAAGDPEWLVLSQHHGGTRRRWSAVPVEAGSHPAVYVALGSHANYFRGDETYPNGVTVGNARLEIVDRTGSHGRVIPQVIPIPNRPDVEADPPSWPDLAWLSYRGRWGETAPQGDFSGPFGPPDKGRQWEQPYAWGMSQPLDVEVWYANRLQVAVEGEAAGTAQVTLRSATGDVLRSVESLGRAALLHADPPRDATIVANIRTTPGTPYSLLAVWPDAGASQATRYRFDGVSGGASGRASLALQEGRPPTLRVTGDPGKLLPTAVETRQVTWDALDPVWLVGFLPATQVLQGVGISLLAGLLPTLLYVALLYSADRYEKEPKAMLATAFLWGAIPAVVVALVVRLFFRLPAHLLGPRAIEAVRAGLVAPVIEEAIKGVVILFIARRYRLEFDNLLDGIIYGAMVGFGFAMAGNTLSYLGAFILRGFAGLSSAIVLEGVLYGLNHALYSAIVGAGLGHARLARRRREHWAIPLAAFALAVLVHSLHNLALYNATGVNPLTVATAWAGTLVILVVIALSLQREQRCLAAELVGEVPEDIYRSLITPGARGRAQWHALRAGGLDAWQHARQVHQQCAELAFKKMLRGRRPDESGLNAEIDRLRRKLAALLGEEG
jgi:RsiW-degrading membrane proteinase PrsW (M82 family)